MTNSCRGGPRKIPLMYAYQTLNESGTINRPEVLVEDLGRLEEDGLVRVAELVQYFGRPVDFRNYKARYLHNIPQEDWQFVVELNPRSRAYCRRYITRSRSSSPPSSGSSSRSSSPLPKSRRLKMKTKLGTQSQGDAIPNDESMMFIRPANDECDDKDVNLPLPVCQGIQRVCRYYGKDRKYEKFKDDKSEKNRYKFKVKYV